MSVFSIQVDSIQMRLEADGLSTLVGAKDWDIAASSNVYQDGVTGTIFLLPGFFDQNGNWLTSNAGIYQKLAPSDFTLVPSSSDLNWSSPTNNTDGAQWLKYSDNTSGAGGITTYSVAENQAIIVEMWVPPGTASSDPIGQFGYGASGDYTTGVSFNFYNNGSADIYQAGSFLFTLTASGQNSDYGQTDGQIPQQAQGQYIAFVIIPCREREILVLCSNGGGFSAILASIPEGTASPVITPSAPIWFNAPIGVDTTWRLALCQYAGAGNAIGKQAFWRYDPGGSPAGGFQAYVEGDLEGGTVSLLVADGVTPSSPYANNTNGVALNVAITGTTQTSGAYTVTTTPFIYAARGYTLPVVANTWGAKPLDVTAYALSLEYDVADSVSGLRAPLILSDPKGIIAAGVALDGTNQPGALIDAITERPWQIYDSSGTQILEGLNESPKLEQGIIFNPATGVASYGTELSPPSNAAESVHLELRDMWLQAENFTFKDPIPLDGLSIAEAYTLVTDTIGITNSAGGLSPNLSAALYTTYMPQAGNPTTDFNTLIEPGDKGSDWMDRIHKTQAGNYFHGLVPMGGWCQPWMLAEADMPSTPALTLYDSYDTAIANGVMTPTYLQLFRKTDVQMLRPEANDIYIRGFDYRTGRPILCHKFDSISANPTIIPANRLPPWRGARVSYCWNDPTLADIGACEYAMSLLYPRLTIARSLIEIECDFNSLIPRGYLVKLYFRSGGGIRSSTDGTLQNPVTCRVKSISASFKQTGNDGRGSLWRPTRYVLQQGLDAANLHTGHSSLAGIRNEWMLRSVSKTVQWGDALDKPVWRRPLIVQHEA